MEDDLYGFTASDVDRLKRLLEAFEGGARLRQTDSQRITSISRDKVETYLALTTSEVTAAQASTSVLTTINANINASVTTANVASVSSMPTDKQFVISVDSEQMLVVNVGNSSVRVSRAWNGTTAANHTSGANVSQTVFRLGSGTALTSQAVPITATSNFQLDETRAQAITIYNRAFSPVPTNSRIALLREPFSGLLVSAGESSWTYLGIALDGMTGLSGSTFGAGTVTLITSVDNGDGTFDMFQTGDTIDALNPCEAIDANSLVELFLEPIHNKYMAQLLCAGTPPPCPCEDACMIVKLPGWSLHAGEDENGDPCLSPVPAGPFTDGHDPDTGILLTFVGEEEGVCRWSGTVVWTTNPQTTLVDLSYDPVGGWQVNVTGAQTCNADCVLGGPGHNVYQVVAPAQLPCNAALTMPCTICNDDSLGPYFCDGGTPIIPFGFVPGDTAILEPCSLSGGSSVGGIGCCFGSCGDSGVAATLTYTVTDKMGSLTSLPSSGTATCYNSAPGFHGWQDDNVNIYCVGNIGVPYIVAGLPITTDADGGYTCSPFSAVFHVDDGAGNSATITVVE